MKGINLYKEIYDKIFGNYLLFLSMDIVDSTKYKYDNVLDGHLAIKKRLDDIVSVVEEKLEYYHLWKVLGDELIFLHILSSGEVKNMFNQLNKISKILDDDINKVDHLKVKTTMWLVEIAKKEKKLTRYDYDTLTNNIDTKKSPVILFINDSLSYVKNNLADFKKALNKCAKKDINIKEMIKSIDLIGTKMDLGFRLSSFAKEELLLISYDIVEIIKEKLNNDMYKHIFIYKFEKLKGINSNNPYPISFWNSGNDLKQYIDKIFYKNINTNNEIRDVYIHDEKYNRHNHFIANKIWGENND